MVSSPMLAPRLIPETTTSGVKSSSPVTAMWTQSVGVPLTEKYPFGARRTASGRSRVSELEAPERSLSGATTVTSPSWRRASASSVMPGAKYPSSFETRIFTRPILQFEQRLPELSKGGALSRRSARPRHRDGLGGAGHGASGPLSRRGRSTRRAEEDPAEGADPGALGARSTDERGAAPAAHRRRGARGARSRRHRGLVRRSGRGAHRRQHRAEGGAPA